eukprot:5843548-Amphidinium_carterae.1
MKLSGTEQLKETRVTWMEHKELAKLRGLSIGSFFHSWTWADYKEQKKDRRRELESAMISTCPGNPVM